MDTTTSLLKQINAGIAQMNSKIAMTMANSEDVSQRAMSPLQSPSVSKVGAAKDVVGILKSMNGISTADLLKFMALPLDTFAKKIEAFTKKLGGITKGDAEKAKMTTAAFLSVIGAIKSIDSTNLRLKLMMFPDKSINKVIDSLLDITSKLAKYKDTLSKEQLGNLIKGFEVPIELSKKYALSVLIFPIAALGTLTAKLFIMGLSSLGDYMIEKFDAKKSKSLTASLNTIGKFGKDIYKQVGFMSLIGLGSVVLLPLVTLGFAVIALTFTGFALTEKLIAKLAKKSEENKVNVSAVMEFAKSSVLILLGAAGIGYLVVNKNLGPQILLGLAAIAVTVTGFAFLSMLIEKFAKPSGGKKGEKHSNVLDVLLFAAGSIAIILAAAGIGVFVSKYWKITLYGLGAMVAVIAGFGAIAWTMGKLSKTLDKAKLPAILILGLGLASGLILMEAIMLGKYMNEAGGWKTLGNSMGAMAALITEFGTLAFIMGKLESTLLKGSLAYALLLGLGAFSINITMKAIDLGKAMNEAGGWKTLGNSMGAVAALVGEFAVLATAIGALMLIPMMPLIMASGIATVTGLGLAANAVASAGIKIMELGKRIDDGNIASSMKSLSVFLDGLNPLIKNLGTWGSGKEIRRAKKTVALIETLIDSISDFSKIMQNVGGENGMIKSIKGYDKDGNPIYDDKLVDIKLVSENIATGFATFMDIIITKLDALKNKEANFGTILAMRAIMSPVTEFADIMKSFADGENGTITPIYIDENGKITQGKPINIAAVSESIASGFSIFTEKIISTLSSMNTSFGALLKSAAMKKTLEPVFDIVNSIKELLPDDNAGTLLTKNIDILSSGFKKFNDDVYKSLSGIQFTIGSRKAIERLCDTIKYFNDGLKDSLTDDAIRDNFTKNINITYDGIRKLNELYINKDVIALNKQLPTLSKNHNDFVSKLKKSLTDVKSPMEKYINNIEKLAKAYDRLQSSYDKQGNLILKVDESTVTNNTYNMDKNAMDDMLKDIVPNMAQAIANILDNSSISVTYDNKNKIQGMEFAASYN